MTKSSRILISTGFLAAFTVFAFAVTDAELQTAMKSTAKSMGALKTGKTGPDAQAAAETVEKSMKASAAYFAEHKVKEAEDWSNAAAKAAGELAAAAKANDETAANTAFRGVASSCKGCHSTYREQLAEGGYKVKLPAH